ncbi:MAG: TonB-dependent receptor, partial [Parasphingorhabdus sp.]
MRLFSKQIISRTTLAAALLAAGIVQPAYAQDEAAADDGQGLDVIVVTAQRREENLQDVPLPVSTISEDKLAALGAGGQDVRALSARVPSLIVESSFGEHRVGD